MIRQVNFERSIIDHWTLGGGTAMMLQIDHRESRDIDLFVQDSQLLGFLDPGKTDFNFEMQPSGYAGDGAKFLKLAFEGIGEIDFIVAQPKTANPAVQQSIEGEIALLETIPEIITKKIVHRGASIKARDVFDIAAASVRHADSIVTELCKYRSEAKAALAALERLNLEFLRQAIAELQIRPKFGAVAKTSIERTREILRTV